jgi:hypothetical protein
MMTFLIGLAIIVGLPIRERTNPVNRNGLKREGGENQTLNLGISNLLITNLQLPANLRAD